MSKHLYMHLINNQPAIYLPGTQIVHFNHHQRIMFEDVFVDSLDTIKRQQQMSRKYRTKQGWGDTPGKYSYIRLTKES